MDSGHIIYALSVLILMVGLYGLIASSNLFKKMIAMAIFQTSVLLLYIGVGKIKGGRTPILECADVTQCPGLYANPLPHVLMLTAIVVGVATLAVGLALVVRIKEAYGTVEEDEIIQLDRKDKSYEHT